MAEHTPECQGLNAGCPGIGCICESIRAEQRVKSLIIPASVIDKRRQEKEERIGKRDLIIFTVVLAICCTILSASMIWGK
jgi:hypothetical protein